MFRQVFITVIPMPSVSTKLLKTAGERSRASPCYILGHPLPSVILGRHAVPTRGSIDCRVKHGNDNIIFSPLSCSGSFFFLVMFGLDPDIHLKL